MYPERSYFNLFIFKTYRYLGLAAIFCFTLKKNKYSLNNCLKVLVLWSLRIEFTSLYLLTIFFFLFKFLLDLDPKQIIPVFDPGKSYGFDQIRIHSKASNVLMSF